MEKVLGIGGVFFRSRDHKALALWYETHLGITMTPKDYESPPWLQMGGATVFEPFKHDSDYFPADNTWMVNFRVRDLDAIVKQLRDAGIEVTVAPETYENGRFARTHDPERNPIELWEPAGPFAGSTY
jgi:glyoxylase I family protein